MIHIVTCTPENVNGLGGEGRRPRLVYRSIDADAVKEAIESFDYLSLEESAWLTRYSDKVPSA